MTALTSSETQDLNRLRQCVLMGHRDTLRVDRLTSLRRDVLTLSGDFVAAGERVGRYAVQSEKAASERSGQIERAAQTHGRALDDIVVGTWRHRLMDVVESSGGRLSDLERAWTQETASVAASNQSDLRFFQRREVEARHAVDDAVEDSKQAFQAAKEAMRNRYMERANNLRVWLGSKIDAIEALFDEEHARYVDATSDRTRDFQALSARDATTSSEIDQRARRADGLIRSVARWRKRLQENQAACLARNAGLRQQRNLVAAQYKALKAAIGRQRDERSSQAKAIARACTTARAQIADAYALSTRVITLANAMLAHGNASFDDEVGDAEASGEGQGAAMQEDPIATFLKRRARAELQNRVMVAARDRQRQTNAQLRQAIMRFLASTTLPADWIDQHNCLFVMNGRHGLLPRQVFHVDPVVAINKVDSVDVVRSQALLHRPACA
ncbi:Dynein regulatory complex protein 1/2 N-terminal domain-containing protein [Plasmodiophora brassicae]|nr:hypothetical protein PBRA_000174 [Plasmodiophora brassicae]